MPTQLLSNPLLNAGLAMAAASGPSAMPVGLGQSLLAGLQGAQQGVQYGLDNKRADQGLQMQQMRMKLMQDQAKQRSEEMVLAAQKAQEEKAQAAALRQQLLSGLGGDPAKMGLLAALDTGQLQKMAMSQLNPEAPDLTTMQKNHQAALADGSFSGGLLEYQTKLANAKRSVNNTNVRVGGGGGFKPLTNSAKMYFDLQNLQKQPQSEARDRAIAELQKKMNTVDAPGAEQRRTDQRMSAVGQIASEFEQIATDLEAKGANATGPIMGQWTKLVASFGALDDSQVAELTSKAAQMKALLGTALSGAAIPVSEWSTYEAQIPAIHDSPSQRRGKLKTYAQMIRTLMAQQNQEVVEATPPGRTPPTYAPTGTHDPRAAAPRGGAGSMRATMKSKYGLK